MNLQLRGNPKEYRRIRENTKTIREISTNFLDDPREIERILDNLRKNLEKEYGINPREYKKIKASPEKLREDTTENGRISQNL